MCKWQEVRGKTTKFFYCKLKNKSVDIKDCNNCMLKIEDKKEQHTTELFEDIFRTIFKEGFGN